MAIVYTAWLGHASRHLRPVELSTRKTIEKQANGNGSGTAWVWRIGAVRRDNGGSSRPAECSGGTSTRKDIP
jgi:hypothetical protein